MKIGIDVGGTNTDSVLLQDNTVLAGVKAPTATNVAAGIVDSLTKLKEQYPFSGSEIEAVIIGTTHFINALVEANRLAPTAAIRLGLPATRGLPPFVGWPDRLRDAVRARHYLCHGGHEFDGREISKLNPDEIRAAVHDAAEHGVRSFAVSSVFSPVNSEFEVETAAIIESVVPDAAISLSHEIGRVGLLERENATIINAALRALSVEVCASLEESLQAFDITAPLFLSQNDGTLMDVDYARRYPVATFASGPTNSMRGAAFLSGLTDCMVVDVGGTTTDVGVLQAGYPREAATEIEVAGVRTNFRMPDVSSIGLGGGSRVHQDNGILVGPDSVGYRISSEAMVFGGSTLTATDVAVGLGFAEVGDRSLVQGLEKSTLVAAKKRIDAMMAEVVDRMRTSATPLPVVAVGGGSILVPGKIPGVSSVIRPENAGVANAIGAAVAQVGGEVDRIYPVPPGARNEVLDSARAEAVEKAVAAGAEPSTIAVVEVDELPLAYLPGNAARIRVKAVGDLAVARPGTTY